MLAWRPFKFIIKGQADFKLEMNLLEQTIVLEKIYNFSDLETKKNIVKYAQKYEFINCDNSLLRIINLVQNRNSTKNSIPCFLCMWQDLLNKL